ncbi:fad linked oxidase domain-containing protein [Ceraceosorus bombacis]|uniref:Fad linked oxidase domain-containing protein n=1 Tax=Ceraceosorus bombacis TaxID=401625 RepID=A0A0P1BA07_9BASI|nr:fad linked oxidase domain-containing protein [Ceraceosorus bombacis]
MATSLDPIGASMPVQTSTPSKRAEEAASRYEELRTQLSGRILARSRPAPSSEDARPSGQPGNSAPVSFTTVHGKDADGNGSDKDFDESVRLFNSAAKCHSTLIVKPKTSQDVSITLRFCREYGLSPSIKSGGYSTAGWATSGDVLIDFQQMDDVKLLKPHGLGGSLTSSDLESAVKSPEPLELPSAVDTPSASESPSKVRKAGDAFSEIAGGDASRQRILGNGHENDQPIVSSSRRSESGDGTPESAEWVDKDGGADLPRTGSNESASTTSMSRTDSTSVDSGSADDHELKTGSDDAPARQTFPQLASSSATASGQRIGRELSLDPMQARNIGSGPTSTFEHERWHRHHRPPTASGLSAGRIHTTLPQGAFVWRQGEDATALNASGQPLPRNHPTSQDAGPRSAPGHEASTGATPALRSLDIDRSTQRNDFSTCALRPGIHTDKYLLASFGPGASIPHLDAYTDKAGRVGLISDQHTSSEAAASRLYQKAPLPMPDTQFANFTAAPYFVPSSAYPVGAASMVTGGFGFITRAYGLSVDNVVELEMVLADGSVHVLNDENAGKSKDAADLWWAARGAATCLGVVTHITMRAYPVPHVYGGSILFPFSPSTADDLVKHWRDVLKGDIPRELYANLILTEGPGGSHVIVIQICDLRGRTADSEALVQALSSWSGERILLKDIEERPFQAQNQFMAQVLRDTGPGKRWLVRGDCLDTLTDECIEATIANFSRSTKGSRVLIFELARGALADADPESGCISRTQREARYALGSIWSGDVDDEQHLKEVDSWVSGTSKHSPIPCFLERGEGLDRVRDSFGHANFERLLEIKRRVDPENVFCHNFLGTLSKEACR